MTEKYNRLKITTKNGLVFELVLADWLKEGDYKFGKVELVEELDKEQGKDYVKAIEDIFEMCNYDDYE